ncbi:MAG: endonuclease VIII [Myxococcota bacterium]
MPEGPEIRRAADRVARAVAGRAPDEVFFAFPHLKPYSEELRQRGVSRVETRGKAMLTWFADDLVVYSHNQLYGRWITRRSNKTPESNRSLRFAVRTPKGSAFLFSASEIEVLEAAQVESHPFLKKLGPDPLAGASARDLRGHFRAFEGRQLGGLLLDQSFVAGMGNYLRSEILFDARLLPWNRLRDLSEEQRRALATSIGRITKRSYRTGGITVPKAMAEAAKRDGEPRRRYRHYVFARAHEACRVCGTPIEKETVAGRRLYWCPECQR